MIKVFVNGSFDLLHTGHINLLYKAKSYGDYLLVALDTDERISLKKGPSRPINKQENRVAIMAALKPVDQVLTFNSDFELEEIIKSYEPDIMMVGNDWLNKTIIGSQYAKKLLFFPRENQESTTATIDNYVKRLLNSV